MVVAAFTAVVPVLAMGGNQELAEQIAANLRKSGQLQGFRIAVKVQDGTVWLSGRVSSQSQLEAAGMLVAQTPGVDRVVNELTVSTPAAVLHQSPRALRADPREQPISTDLMVPSVSRSTAGRSARMASLPMAQRLARSANAQLQLSEGESLRAIPSADPVPSSFTARPAQQVVATGRSYAMTKAERNKRVTAKRIPSRPAAPTRPSPQRRMVAVPMVPVGYYMQQPMPVTGAQPVPQYVAPAGGGIAPARYDQPHLPSYAWPSYAAYPNYAALTYPKQYSPTAWPYIGPFYPYPQVPLGWRKVVLEWHDGWWHLDFDDGGTRGGPISGLFRPPWKHRR